MPQRVPPALQGRQMTISLYVLARLFAIENDLRMPSARCRRALLLGVGVLKGKHRAFFSDWFCIVLLDLPMQGERDCSFSESCGSAEQYS